MNNTPHITLISNAGLLVTYQGISFMIDGIYGREDHPFSNLTSETWQAMLTGSGHFSRVDYLLFTHAHPDHFSPEMTEEFLRHRDVKGLFLPTPHTKGEERLAELLRERGTPCVQLSGMTDHVTFKIEPEITVRAFQTAHLDPKYREVPHFCYLLTLGGTNLLLTADVDYVHETLAFLRPFTIDAAFVNPLFFSALSHGKFFKGTLDARQLFVYHVPFPEDDTMKMLPTLQRDLNAWHESGRTAVALQTRFQEIEL